MHDKTRFEFVASTALLALEALETGQTTKAHEYLRSIDREVRRTTKAAERYREEH